MDAFNGKAGAQRGTGSDPACRRELDALRAKLDRPKPHLDYTIGGTVEHSVHDAERAQRAARMRRLSERLGLQDGAAKEGFGKAKAQDRARGEFERSR